jgi:hypothetical protein
MGENEELTGLRLLIDTRALHTSHFLQSNKSKCRNPFAWSFSTSVRSSSLFKDEGKWILQPTKEEEEEEEWRW